MRMALRNWSGQDDFPRHRAGTSLASSLNNAGKVDQKQMAEKKKEKESRKPIVITGAVFLFVLLAGSFALMHRINEVVEQRQELMPTVEPHKAGNLRLGDPMPNLHLETPDGQPWDLHSAMTPGRFTVVTFHHPDCPCAESCGRLIAEMAEEGYEDVEVFGILASGFEDERVLTALEEQEREGIVTFPILYDRGWKVKEQLGATRTPEIWVLDKDQRVAYYGAPENTLFPGSEGHRFLLREAIDALREGRTPEIQSHPSIGCLIQ